MSSLDKSIRAAVVELGAMGASLARHPAVMTGGESANMVRIMPVLEAISASVTHLGGGFWPGDQGG